MFNLMSFTAEMPLDKMMSCSATHIIYVKIAILVMSLAFE